MHNHFISCQVTELNDHPQANKLKVAKVFDGKSHYTVVCGAKNIRLNMITVLAQIGATTAQGLQIKESAIRGVTSQGMLCSPLELGISSEQGIIDLPPQTKVGTNLSQISTDLLSSTPWWSYKLVEKFYVDPAKSTISIQRGNFTEAPKNLMLTSETYWHEGQYHYRHFA
jgi:tRNA-binding EMAP/Myf-like protein